jgi:flagellar protein FlaI
MEESFTEYESNVENSTLFKDFYPVNPPFGFVGIEKEASGTLKYVITEPTLDEVGIQILNEIKKSLIDRMDIPLSVLKDDSIMREYLNEQIMTVFKKYKKDVAEESKGKYIYYLMRDFLGYGKIDIIMRDPKIEDISCNGVNIPIYVYHQNYESLPTNIIYETEEELDAIITRLAYKTKQQISVAHPILEGTLPEGYRAHITLDEVSKRGDTFTIRKFGENPFTIIDLINVGTISIKIAAYLWILVENLRSIMICGATASGKTSLLNSLCMFINPKMKVITIEEVRELRLHENWIPVVTRSSFQPGVEEITTFDLLKSALRQRPDIIIVGEVRGEEVYTLFQSIAVGHGGLCTIHADSIDSVIKRLMSRPMNVPETMLSLMNIMIQLKQVEVDNKIVRRVVNINELAGIPIMRAARGLEIVEINSRFEWQSEDDTFIEHPIDEADILLNQGRDIFSLISKINHIPFDKLIEEQKQREIILGWMVENKISDYDEVIKIIMNYYHNPDEVYNMARFG